MSNKTCGECKHYIAMNRCIVHGQFVHDDDCCDYYASKPKVITNGDVIRQKSNEEWATIWSEQAFLFAWCYDCMGYCKDGNTPEAHAKCKKQMLNWLNAPADCVKQNGNHDTQTDLCKADNTESEGEKDE